MINKLLNNINVKGKFFIIYFICVAFPLVSANFFLLYTARKNIKGMEINQVHTSIERMNMRLKYEIDGIISFTNTLISDDNLSNKLNYKYLSTADFIEDYTNFYKPDIHKYDGVYRQISDVTIFTNNSTIPDSDGLQYLNEEVKKNQWYKDFINSDKNIIVLPVTENEKSGLSFVRSFYSKHISYNDRNNQIIKVNLNLNNLNDILKSEKIDCDIFVVDKQNRVLLSSNHNYQSNNKFVNFSDIKFNKKNLMFIDDLSLDVYSKANGDQWRIIYSVDVSKLYNDVNNVQRIIVLIGLMSLLIVSVIILLVSKSFSDRLRLLYKHITNVGRQNYERIICDEGKDEIGETIREFNRMADKIDTLINDVYESNIREQSLDISKKQAELNALQSQIEPHFLFNTLESIRMRSIIKKELETASIIKYLSNIFRHSLTWDNDLIKVSEELKYIKDFLSIQKYRYGNKIDYVVNAEEETYGFYIPKMMLQPFVENACVHGMEEQMDTVTVTIDIKKEENFITCLISDNGAGMCDETLKEVIRNIMDPDQTSSVGLRNVYNRLALLYGQAFGFNILSEENKGTTIHLSLPVK